MKPPSRARSGSSGRKRPAELGDRARRDRPEPPPPAMQPGRQTARHRPGAGAALPAAIEAVAQRRQIARAAAPDQQARQRALDVGRALQRLRADPRASRALGDEAAAPRRAAPSMAAGSVSGAASRSARSRAPAAVTVRSMAASRQPWRSPDEAAGQLEIAPRRRIDLHDRAGGEAPRRGRGAAACPAGSSGDSRPARRRRRSRPARSCRSRRAPRPRRPAPAAGAPPSLSKRAAGSGVSAARPNSARSCRKLGLLEQPVRQQDLAGREPRERGRRARSAPAAAPRNRRSRDRARRGPCAPPASASAAR